MQTLGNTTSKVIAVGAQRVFRKLRNFSYLLVLGDTLDFCIHTYSLVTDQHLGLKHHFIIHNFRIYSGSEILLVFVCLILLVRIVYNLCFGWLDIGICVLRKGPALGGPG